MKGFRPDWRMCTPGELTTAPFNPKSRTERDKLKKLIDGIKEVGGIIQPIIVSSDFQVIDGHRRLAAAKALGMTEVPVIVSPLSLQAGWRVLNTTSLGVVSKDWVQAHYLGYSLGNIPRKQRREIETIYRLIGEDGFANIAEAGMSSNVASEARYVAKYIEGKSGRERPSDDMHREVLLWMIECKQQPHAKSAVKNGMDPDILRLAVVKRKKLHR